MYRNSIICYSISILLFLLAGFHDSFAQHEYEVETLIFPLDFENSDPAGHRIEFNTGAFATWIISQVEAGELTVYKSSAKKEVIELAQLREALFPYYFIDGAYSSGEDGFDTGAWKKKTEETGSLAAAIEAMNPPSSSLDIQGYQIKVSTEEDWIIEDGELEANCNGIRVDLARYKKLAGAVSSIFLPIDPEELAPETYHVIPNLGAPRPKKNEKVFQKSWYKHDIIGYREPGNGLWVRDPAKTGELQQLADMDKVEKLRKKAKRNHQLHAVRFGIVANRKNSQFKSWSKVGVTHLDTSEFKLSRHFVKEIIYPTFEGVLKGDIKAYDPDAVVQRDEHIRIEDPLKAFWQTENAYKSMDMIRKSPQESMTLEKALGMKSRVGQYFEVLTEVHRGHHMVGIHKDHLILFNCDPAETLPPQMFAAIKVTDIKLKFHGEKLVHFLESLNYRFDLVAIQGQSAMGLPEGIWYEQIMMSSEWEKFPSMTEIAKFRKMKDEEKMPWVVSNHGKPELKPLKPFDPNE